MKSGRRDALMTIEAAAELTSIDIQKIRRWVADGLLEVQRRGEIETVLLADVDRLATIGIARTRAERRGALRSLLREAPISEPRDVTDLQKLVRERAK